MSYGFSLRFPLLANSLICHFLHNTVAELTPLMR
nr:MAG TPA: hypothetical protein [Caudoviricetes sp.]